MFTVKFETMDGQTKTRNIPDAYSVESACNILMQQADVRVGNILAVFYDGIKVA